mgnify:FL=1
MERGEVRLRALEPEDVDRLYIWENDRDMWPFGGTRAPLSRHQLWEYATNYDANPFAAGQLRLIIELATAPDNAIPQSSQSSQSSQNSQNSQSSPIPCGIIDLYDIDPVNSRAMVGIMVAPRWRSRGIATRALELVGEYCRDILGLATIASEVASDNLPSIRLFGEKAAYRQVGERPSWYRRGERFVSALLFQKQLR